MPVRKIPRNYRNITGRVAGGNPASGVKSGVGFESSLERDLYILLDFDLNVHHFEEQPVRVTFRDKLDRPHVYTPDVLITYRSDIVPANTMPPVLAEVKYRQDLFDQWKELKPKFRAARLHARERSWRFRILTEVEIRTPYLDNVRFLRGYRKAEASFEAVHLILDTLLELRSVTPEALMLACFKDPTNRAELIPVLWKLIATRRVGCDLDTPLTMHSPLWTLDCT